MRKSIQAALIFCLVAGLCVLSYAGEAGKEKEGAFFVKEGDAFSLNISTLLQIRADYTDDEVNFSGPLYEDEQDLDFDARTDFLVRRARLRFYGQAGTEWLSYMLDVDMVGELETSYSKDGFGFTGYDTKLSPDLQDAWLRMRLGENHSLTIGQQKDPFDYFFNEYSRDQMFLERPYVTTEWFAPGRQVGMRYAGHSKSDRVGWDLMLSNGGGMNHQRNDNDKLAYSARIYLQTPGFIGSGMTALPGKYQGVRYGVGVAIHQNSIGSDLSCDSRGVTLVCGYDTNDVSAYEVFGGISGTKVRFNGSWQSWTMDNAGYDRQGRLDDLNLDAYTAEIGFFAGEKSELAVRYESGDSDPIDFDFGGDLQSELQSDVFTVGYNFYFSGNHNFKLQANVGQFKMTFKDRFLDMYMGETIIPGEMETKSNFIRLGIQHAF